jgi:hypothetical protein
MPAQVGAHHLVLPAQGVHLRPRPGGQRGAVQQATVGAPKVAPIQGRTVAAGCLSWCGCSKAM